MQNGGYDEQERSIVYRWQGLDQFVPAHSMFTFPSADWESFTHDGEQYLIYANGKSTTSQIIKAKYL